MPASLRALQMRNKHPAAVIPHAMELRTVGFVALRDPISLQRAYAGLAGLGIDRLTLREGCGAQFGPDDEPTPPNPCSMGIARLSIQRIFGERKVFSEG